MDTTNSDYKITPAPTGKARKKERQPENYSRNIKKKDRYGLENLY